MPVPLLTIHGFYKMDGTTYISVLHQLTLESPTLLIQAQVHNHKRYTTYISKTKSCLYHIERLVTCLSVWIYMHLFTFLYVYIHTLTCPWNVTLKADIAVFPAVIGVPKKLVRILTIDYKPATYNILSQEPNHTPG